eukprot:g209.t1
MSDYSRLVPTFCDRRAFLWSVLPFACRARAREAPPISRVTEAKRYFLKTLRSTGRSEICKIRAITNAILKKIEWLLFPIDVGGSRDDGTENLGIIFERLALREAMFTRPSNPSCYSEMHGVDFVRNLLLGPFMRDEALALKMYKQHWLAVERAANRASKRDGELGGENVLSSMLEAYLSANVTEAQRKRREKSSYYQSDISKMIGGKLYADFRDYVSSTDSSLSGEQLLLRVKAFALKHFSRDGDDSTRNEQTVVREEIRMPAIAES